MTDQEAAQYSLRRACAILDKAGDLKARGLRSETKTARHIVHDPPLAPAERPNPPTTADERVSYEL